MGTPGFAIVPNWMIRDTNISAYGIAVFVALASHSGPGGIYPSHATLAAESRCSERKVRAALNELKDIGVITWTKRRDPKLGQITNTYTLLVNGPETDDTRRHTVPGGGGTSEQELAAPGADEEEPTTYGRKKNPKRATPVPTDFAITDEQRAWAVKDAPLVDLDKALPEWIDYWQGTGRSMVDWNATWRNGMRKQQSFAERNRPQGSAQGAQRSLSDFQAERDAAIARNEADARAEFERRNQL
jgi:hypothetical protein